jgi:hypothetical protein
LITRRRARIGGIGIITVGGIRRRHALVLDAHLLARALSDLVDIELRTVLEREAAEPLGRPYATAAAASEAQTYADREPREHITTDPTNIMSSSVH